MGKRILITGGAGFIGSHLADHFLEQGHRVRALDNLADQGHGLRSGRPAYLAEDVDLHVADVRDAEAVRKALAGMDAVVHLAAAVGAGQSMYEVERYTSVNNLGTAVLLEALLAHPVERLVVGSTMSVYGEGLYHDLAGEPTLATPRTRAQLRARRWEVQDAHGEALVPVPTPEGKAPSLTSVYALSKYDQERLCLMLGEAYGVPTVALRLFNVYGTRQALSNPYAGVLAIFASRLAAGRAPLVFEDGQQQRDFVSVYDVAQACSLALTSPAAAGRVFNIGSGRPCTVEHVARRLAETLGREHIEPEISGEYRTGDIRHCFADITLARSVLGYSPMVGLDDGLQELAGWLEGQAPADPARVEPAGRGLTA